MRQLETIASIERQINDLDYKIPGFAEHRHEDDGPHGAEDDEPKGILENAITAEHFRDLPAITIWTPWPRCPSPLMR